MDMKHRWTGVLLIALGLALGACTPTDAGADDESTAPSVEASPVEANPTATPVPDPDEY